MIHLFGMGGAPCSTPVDDENGAGRGGSGRKPPPPEAIPPKLMIGMVRGAIIGNDSTLQTPFGTKLMTYADYTASGRQLQMIEDFMTYDVAPTYANTHTELSATGRQTNHLREEARAVVETFTHADPAVYATLFVGTGMTGCVHKLIDCLGIKLPAQLEANFNLLRHIPKDARPVVFHGPFEHHSNILSWRETIADVVEIPEVVETGRVDVAFLKRELAKYKARPLKIVTVSAGSNVSGIVSPIGEIARVARAGGALCFADYAGAGPYVSVDVHPEPGVSLDAIFLSPHKLVGGPGSAGVLIVKRSVLTNSVPSQPGGGTVAYVSSTSHDYADAIEAREDGGTPAVLQAIRCGVAFQVRKLVTVELTSEINLKYCMKAIERWSKHPNIFLMGSDRSEYRSKRRLPIISFNFLMPEEGAAPPSGAPPSWRARRKMLHPHFVCALLNDLYGVQSRSGCSCAGPYGVRLWGIGDAEQERLRSIVLKHGLDAAKPGWCRVNLCWTHSPEEVDFIIEAVEQAATHGWKLLPQYATDWRSGAYQHRTWNPNDELKWICVVCAGLKHGQPPGPGGDAQRPERSKHLADAAELYERGRELAEPLRAEIAAPGGDFIEADAGALAPGVDEQAAEWMYSHYAFPSDAVGRLFGGKPLPLGAKGALFGNAPESQSRLLRTDTKTRMVAESASHASTIMSRTDKSVFTTIAKRAADARVATLVRSS